MANEDVTRRLAMIASFDRFELGGYWAAITTGVGGFRRAPLDGEIAACLDRAKSLGVNLVAQP